MYRGSSGHTPTGSSLLRLGASGKARKAAFDKSAIPGRFDLENEDFWRALRVLEHSHVVEWAVYTANGKPADKYATGRPAKPVSVVRNGVIQVAAPESRLGRLAHAIYCAHEDPAADPTVSMRHWQQRGFLTAIEHASVPHIEGVGILRMTYRADTDNAKAWWQQINAECREAISFYARVAGAIGVQVPDIVDITAPVLEDLAPGGILGDEHTRVVKARFTGWHARRLIERRFDETRNTAACRSQTSR